MGKVHGDDSMRNTRRPKPQPERLPKTERASNIDVGSIAFSDDSEIGDLDLDVALKDLERHLYQKDRNRARARANTKPRVTGSAAIGRPPSKPMLKSTDDHVNVISGGEEGEIEYPRGTYSRITKEDGKLKQAGQKIKASVKGKAAGRNHSMHQSTSGPHSSEINGSDGEEVNSPPFLPRRGFKNARISSQARRNVVIIVSDSDDE
ncbi:hypothetical protein FA15DRAFT_672229 [Coprinopsis marcescibilis]|uniref:Uncharacterized protein n=1 Tax=Coprinopsis marcescibilis TaxID=230819 RepID=A0A5C3KMU2_COPMA|nr:hypothetical protein FA15DRAFT_672229 [Coprinopsis marcescibilis]